MTRSASSWASGTSTLLSDQPGTVGEAAVLRELRLDHVEVGHRVAAGLEGGAVQDVDEGRAALDVPEELQPEALALARARDQPGHVGDGEADVARLHHARGWAPGS